MDQKTYPNLNPKLKETYDRIMGTTAKPSSSHSPVQKTAASIHHEAVAPSPTTPSHHVTPAHLSHIAYNASMAHKKEKSQGEEKGKATTPNLKNDSLLLPIILATGGVIFFVVYAIFWMSFFGMQ